MKNKCKNCKYHDFTYCRRYPPLVYTYTDRDNDIVSNEGFPTVADDDWCGEFNGLTK